MLEEICCSQFAWVIASHSNLFGGSVLFEYGLNFYGMPLKIIGFCKQSLHEKCLNMELFLVRIFLYLD